MDRGIPTEVVPAEMRASDPPVQYLVGTPKGRLGPWRRAFSGAIRIGHIPGAVSTLLLPVVYEVPLHELMHVLEVGEHVHG